MNFGNNNTAVSLSFKKRSFVYYVLIIKGTQYLGQMQKWSMHVRHLLVYVGQQFVQCLFRRYLI